MVEEIRSTVKHIYIITTMKFGWKTNALGREDMCMLRSRSLGWFLTKEDAERTILGNYGDIYENGYYPTAMIEEVEPGLYPNTEKSWWFEWKEGAGYQPSEKPESCERVIGFSLG